LSTTEGLSAERRDGAIALLIVLTVDTMAGFLGNVLDLLSRRSDLQDLIRAEPGRINDFVEEALRTHGPVRQRPRIVAGTGIEVGGVAIPHGATVQVVLESASRDPDAYPAPDDFSIDRDRPPVLAFAAGPHICAGAAFARTLAKRFLTTLVSRYRITPGSGRPRRFEHPDLRQLASLPLRLEPLEATLSIDGGRRARFR
jgi:cytochrome P450